MYMTAVKGEHGDVKKIKANHPNNGAHTQNNHN